MDDQQFGGRRCGFALGAVLEAAFASSWRQVCRKSLHFVQMSFYSHPAPGWGSCCRGSAREQVLQLPFAQAAQSGVLWRAVGADDDGKRQCELRVSELFGGAIVSASAMSKGR